MYLCSRMAVYARALYASTVPVHVRTAMRAAVKIQDLFLKNNLPVGSVYMYI